MRQPRPAAAARVNRVLTPAAAACTRLLDRRTCVSRLVRLLLAAVIGPDRGDARVGGAGLAAGPGAAGRDGAGPPRAAADRPGHLGAARVTVALERPGWGAVLLRLEVDRCRAGGGGGAAGRHDPARRVGLVPLPALLLGQNPAGGCRGASGVHLHWCGRRQAQAEPGGRTTMSSACCPGLRRVAVSDVQVWVADGGIGAELASERTLPRIRPGNRRWPPDRACAVQRRRSATCRCRCRPQGSTIARTRSQVQRDARRPSRQRRWPARSRRWPRCKRVGRRGRPAGGCVVRSGDAAAARHDACRVRPRHRQAAARRAASARPSSTRCRWTPTRPRPTRRCRRCASCCGRPPAPRPRRWRCRARRTGPGPVRGPSGGRPGPCGVRRPAGAVAGARGRQRAGVVDDEPHGRDGA